MKKAVMYGAGNIGRGFVGRVFSKSGYEVVFLDVAKEIVEAFNKYKQYDVHIVSDNTKEVETVKNVRALHADTNEAIEEIATCDSMATSVGVNVMEIIAKNIAKGIQRRMQINDKPLDILLAENQLGAAELMHDWIYQHLDTQEQEWADHNLGLVSCTISTMVPPLLGHAREDNPLLMAVEHYALLPVDELAFKGEIPDLVGLVPFSPFEYHTKLKLFVQNMSHALVAYFGWSMGLEYISDAMRIPMIEHRARESMMMVADALNKQYGVPMEEIEEFINGLLDRYKNKALRDTVARVGQDPIRKIRKNDRLVGAALYGISFGSDPAYIVKGIVAALQYDNMDDASAVQLQKDLENKGIHFVVEHYMGLKEDELLAQMIVKEYKNSNK